MPEPLILTVNGGSSSIKFAAYSALRAGQRILHGQVERIGDPGARLTATLADGRAAEEGMAAADHRAAARALIEWLRKETGAAAVAGIGHRVVHGGLHLVEHQVVDDALLAELKRTQPLDLAHLPREIALIEAFREAFPGLAQVACFDTAFHHEMPRVAQLLPIPRKYLDQGVRRFGFHGLSYTYLMGELARVAGEAARGRVILAHLGSGASMAAVHEGKPVETTMAFTPTAGIVMGTRPGDLDPGLLVYLARVEKLSPEGMDRLISTECGMRGVSGTSSDMRDLAQRRAAGDVAAGEAVELFCYSARKMIGALAAVLGGVETIVFSGGIGEHSPESRAGICDGLGFLGIAVDAGRNAANAAVISPEGAPVTVRVMATDEESVIAAAVARALEKAAAK